MDVSTEERVIKLPRAYNYDYFAHIMDSMVREPF